jgi:dTDP-4-dehydrorhamnose 3,5-epimerase
MKNWTLKPAFADHRGKITDILDDVKINSITLITTAKGHVRGNHYHKKTVQYIYMLKGRISYVTRKGKGKISKVTLQAGDLVVSPPMEAHTVVALTDCEFLSLSHGPRHGGSFEQDTFRLEDPLVIPPKKR